MINIPNNDSHIIDQKRLLIDLTEHMINQKPIKILLNNEGPCAESLGLYGILDQLTAEFNYNKNNITISTCNLIEAHPDYNISIDTHESYLGSARQFSRSYPLKPKEFNKEFKHFGNFIGHGNVHRLHLASYLHQQYSNKTLQSYHYNRHSEYHRNFMGIEDMLFGEYSYEEVDCAYEFLKQTPLTVDQIDAYPILNPATLNITKVYHEFFVEVVGLTYFSGNTFYLDEKIWRPMIMRTPFIIQGPQNYIKNLQRLGFKTFSDFWDEGYSEDPGRSHIDGIIANINQIAKYSVAELEQMYTDMQPILEHNYQRLMSITNREFETLCKN